MAINFNLLPPEYLVKKGFGAVARVVRSITVITLILFVVFTLGVLAFLIISSRNLNQLTANVQSLKTQVKSQETTEQRLVLLKDRLSKIKIVDSISSSSESLEQIEPVLDSITDSSVGELNIDPTKIETSIVFSNREGLTNFFNNLSNSTVFKSIVMTSFGFNPSTGYLASLRFTNK